MAVSYRNTNIIKMPFCYFLLLINSEEFVAEHTVPFKSLGSVRFLKGCLRSLMFSSKNCNIIKYFYDFLFHCI